MSHRWSIMSGTLLGIALSIHPLSIVSPSYAADLSMGEQRYGIDQDGNAVKLSPPPGKGADLPAHVPPESSRLGGNRKGGSPPLPSPASPVVPVARVAPLTVVRSPEKKKGGEGIPAGKGDSLSPMVHSLSPMKISIPPRPVVGGGLQGALPKRSGTVVVGRSPGVTPREAVRQAALPRYFLKIDSLNLLTGTRPVEEQLRRNGIAILDAKTERTIRVVHRLVVGTFDSREKAQECLRTVQPKLKSAYVMSNNGRHGVYCGSFYKLQKARDKAAQLKPCGVHMTIQHEEVEISHTITKAGPYAGPDAARDASLRLLRLGIPAAIISGV